MAWVAIGLAVGFTAVVAFRVWRRWIEPWRELDELVRDIAAGKTPRKFLMTGNSPARSIGLILEELSQRLGGLKRAAQEETLGVQTILGALPDGLVVVDERGRVQLSNGEFRRLFGAATAGAALFESVRDAAVEVLLQAALNNGEPQRGSIRLRSGNERLELEVSAVPFERNARGTGGAVILFRDVTHLRQVEEVRRDFVANVSHELRTPLSIFRGYLETLLDHPQPPPDELVRILEVMERHSERLTSLVDDVLSLARLEAPEARLDFAAVSLPEFLESTLRDWAKRFADKQLRHHLEMPADLLPLTADEARLQEIIYNLLDNAVKYSSAGGAITVRVVRDSDRVRLSVSDQGTGIPARELPRIFERFYRADKARSRQLGGTGLGLSIVKHIAQLHGGSVEAESELARGTTITVILPLHAPAAALSVTES